VVVRVTTPNGLQTMNFTGAMNASRNAMVITDAKTDPNQLDASFAMLVQSSNHAPALSKMNTLEGATELNPLTIPYATLLGASNATDIDHDALGFLVTAVSNGTLVINGTPADPGNVIIVAGDDVKWTPAAGAKGLSYWYPLSTELTIRQ
jgi:hypothetical protein